MNFITTFRTTQELRNAIRIIAQKKEWSMSRVINKLIQIGLQHIK